MCGICGKIYFDRQRQVSPKLLEAMLTSIRHRGPDDEGLYRKGHVALGHRRLSIIDLNSGHQPIANEDGTIWVVFNGEIYNFRELRQYLRAKGHLFRTNTDTEVIVHLYEEFGPDCVQKMRGMFAFALWDDKAQLLMLGRDRVGIKPLYYCANSSSIVFASEIKAILNDPEVESAVRPEAIDRFLTFYYTPGEETLFHGISKVKPGTVLIATNGRVTTKQYWDLDFGEPPKTVDRREVEGQLRETLSEAVDLHMISDVPVGFLLSGGFDSTAMLALGSSRTDKPLSTFTVGFTDSHVPDERPYARLAASRFGTTHYETTFTADDFRDQLPAYVWHMEEPVAEPPAIALYYVSKLASRHVKVVISGEGGDEAFAGYSQYRNMLWLEGAKRLLGRAAHAAGPVIAALNSLLSSPRVARYAAMMDRPFAEYYHSRSSDPFTFFNRDFLHLYSSNFASHVDKHRSTSPSRRYLQNSEQWDMLSRMLYVDTKTWLVDDLLLKADKMTMANSLELRVPLLDHKVLEFAAALPSQLKVRGTATKYVAKKALAGLIPEEILRRPKAGFPVPYASWLSGPLCGWVHDVLTDGKTLSRGYFNRKGTEDLLSANVRTGHYAKEIFCLVVLELWHRMFLDYRAQTAIQDRVRGGRRVLYGDKVSIYEPAFGQGLPRSLCVEALKE